VIVVVGVVLADETPEVGVLLLDVGESALLQHQHH